MDLFISRDDAGRKAYASARLRQDVLEALYEALETADLSRAELAKRLGVRKGAVSQVLNGDGNLRMKTLAEYLSAMGFQARMHVEVFDFGEKSGHQEKQSGLKAHISKRSGQDSENTQHNQLAGFDWQESSSPSKSKTFIASFNSETESGTSRVELVIEHEGPLGRLCKVNESANSPLDVGVATGHSTTTETAKHYVYQS